MSAQDQFSDLTLEQLMNSQRVTELLSKLEGRVYVTNLVCELFPTQIEQFIEQYGDMVGWEVLSSTLLINKELFYKYKDNWYRSAISGNPSLPAECVLENPQSFDWEWLQAVRGDIEKLLEVHPTKRDLSILRDNPHLNLAN